MGLQLNQPVSNLGPTITFATNVPQYSRQFGIQNMHLLSLHIEYTQDASNAADYIELWPAYHWEEDADGDEHFVEIKPSPQYDSSLGSGPVTGGVIPYTHEDLYRINLDGYGTSDVARFIVEFHPKGRFAYAVIVARVQGTSAAGTMDWWSVGTVLTGGEPPEYGDMGFRGVEIG